MKLIVGLGNPGDEFVGTRHNLGFWVLDQFAAREEISFVTKSKFQADISEMMLEDEKVLLAKPQTFYNEVGLSYLSLRSFHKITPENTLIIHDDLALPFGAIRIRQGGSDAGNNGIKSINIHGGEQSWRLRVGIATEQRAVVGDTHFVLSRFNAEERAAKNHNVATLLSYIDHFIVGDLQPHSDILV